MATDIQSPTPDYTMTIDGVAKSGLKKVGTLGASFIGYPKATNATVAITPAVARTSCVVRPYRSGRTITKSGNTFSFQTVPGEKVSVEFDGDLTKPFFLFHDIPDPVSNATYQADPNCIYYGPGTHTGQGEIVVGVGQTLFVADGARVEGYVRCGGGLSSSPRAAGTIKIRGRGIIDSTAYSGRPLRANKVDKIDIEGPIFVGQDAWGVVLRECGTATVSSVVDNIKSINELRTAGGTPDGIDLVGCRNTTVKNSFVRSYDDGIAIKNAKDGWGGNVQDITIDNIVIWNGEGGNGVEIGYETGPSGSWITNVNYNKLRIIHKKAKTPTYRRAAISIHNAGPCAVYDISYNDVVVEDCEENFMYFSVIQDPDYPLGGIGSVHDITVTGFNVSGGLSNLPVQVRGYDSSHKIYNVSISGMIDHGVAQNTKALANVQESFTDTATITVT